MEHEKAELAVKILEVVSENELSASDSELMMSRCEEAEEQVLKLEGTIIELEEVERERDILQTLRDAGRKRIEILEEEKGLLKDDLVRTANNLREMSHLLTMFKDGDL